MKCKNCNQSVSKNDLCCPHCGSQDYLKTNNSNKPAVIIIVAVIIFIVAFIISFATEHNVDSDEFFDSGLDNILNEEDIVLSADKDFSIQYLDYIIPAGFEYSAYYEDHNRSRIYYYSTPDASTIRVEMAVKYIEENQTIEEHVKSDILAYLTDEVTETEIININDSDWNYFEVISKYNTDYVYYKEYKSKIYITKIEVGNSNIDSFQPIKDKIVNSFKLN